MKSRPPVRRIPVFAGVAAIIAMGAMTAGCGTSEQAPETSTTTTTTTSTTTPPPPPPPTPTEKNLDPRGGNKFTPTHVEPPPPPTGRRGYLPQG